MKKSRDPALIEPFLRDESRMAGGHAEEVAWPETPEQACDVLRGWFEAGVPVTVSGGGTGVVGGRVPFGGAVLATDRLSRIGTLIEDGAGGARLRVEAGVPLLEIQRFCAEHGWHYPPDATENSAFLGGTLATNASGARSFRFGATRRWVKAARFALPDGRELKLRRGEVLSRDGRFDLPLPGGECLRVPAPDWSLPATSKHASGYYSAPRMDLLDLLIGSEGTLGVFLEAELQLLPAPRDLLAGIFFFPGEAQAYEFVRQARGDRLQGAGGVRPWSLELFAHSALALLARSEITLPDGAHCAIFFEEGLSTADAADEQQRLEAWIELGQRCEASEESWVASSLEDDRRFREFRHAIPLTINETLARRGVGKISTDTAVPEGQAPALLAAYRELLDAENLERVIFGHVGDDHVHINVLARDSEQEPRARESFWEMIRIAAAMGGNVAAEHGLGKLKARALEMQYGAEVIGKMRAIREAIDPLRRMGAATLVPESRIG